MSALSAVPQLRRIADGHHRGQCVASGNELRRRLPNGEQARMKSALVLASTSSDQPRILAYNRILKDTNG
ncbi:MAG: DUF1015 family protein [Planctomycetaceae bacterium]